MIVTIMQPAYLPWLGYFDRLRRADLLVLLDHVAMDRNSRTKFANRNRIRTPVGSTWLTVPIETRGARDTAIGELGVIDDGWRRRHRTTIEHHYCRAVHFDAHKESLDTIYAATYRTLADVAAATTGWLASALGISTPSISSSTLNPLLSKSELILELCTCVGANTYLSGPFGREYLQLESFSEKGIQVVFHDYVHPTYRQVYDPFEHNMSALDLVLNCGPESRSILENSMPQHLSRRQSS